jgi:hypothetical protein
MMRLILLLLLLCWQGAFAQTLFMNTTDITTGTRTIITNNHLGSKITPDDSVARKGLLFFSAGYQKRGSGINSSEVYFVDLNYVHKDTRLGCLKDSDGKIILTLADGTTIECMQMSDTDCDVAEFSADYALMSKKDNPEIMKSNFDKLLTTPISEITLFTTERELSFPLKTASKEYLRNHFTLLNKTISAPK